MTEYQITPYATVADYESRYGAVDDADMLLETLREASVEIQAALDRHGIDYAEPDQAFAYRLMVACRQMAHRAVEATLAETPLDVTQYSIAAGGYTQSLSMSSGYGQVRVSRAEWPLLGIGSGKVGWCNPFEVS